MVIRSKSKKLSINEAYAESDSKTEQLPDSERLVKFMEILMQIDQRQKNSGKSR